MILFLWACGTPSGSDWKNADLQLDVVGLPFDDEDPVRVCVEGLGLVDSAAGTGLIAIPGIPADAPVTVTVVDVAQARGAGPVVFAERGYLAVDSAPAPEEPLACDDSVSTEPDGWLLAVRLLP